jgi:hypothetical protein
MSYRPGLPKVLKGIEMRIEGGEKIGVVGRYGCFFFTWVDCYWVELIVVIIGLVRENLR